MRVLSWPASSQQAAMRNEPVFVEATQSLVERYYGARPPISFRGYVAVLDGEPIGVGGVYRTGGLWVAFSEMKDEMRPFVKARARAARLLVNFADRLGVTVHAVEDPNEPTSPGLLKKLGFEKTGMVTDMGELLVRQPKWHS